MIPIYIGTDPTQKLATAVLKHSILARTHETVRFVELEGIASKLQQPMRTGFSFYRFSVPEHAQFCGRAIYLDADIICLSDIDALFRLDMGAHGVLARPRGEERPPAWHYTSVLLFQCERLAHWRWDSLCEQANTQKQSYRAMMWARRDSPYYADYGALPDAFNHLNEHDATTKLLHFTHVESQPWRQSGHPLAHLWVRELASALDAGVVTTSHIEEAIAAGHVRPEVLREVLNP